MEMLIGGKKVGAKDGKRIDVFNPATGEVIDSIPSATIEDLDEMLEYAQAGKVEWAETPLHKRCDVLRKYAELIAEHREELAMLICKETGKSIKEARAEMTRIDILARGFAERANHLYTDVLTDAQGGMEKDYFITVREPLGVILCIVPFNYPASLYIQKVASAIAMGNAIIIKPATDTPLTNIRMTELLLDAGVPGNVAQIVTGKGAVVGDYLASSPKINAVSLTGGTDAGISVAVAAAKNLNPAILELGGNDVFIVLDDADLELAVQESVAIGRQINAGQACSATKRFLVHNAVKERYTELLVERLGKVRVGDPMDPNTDIGCLINEKAAIEVEQQVQHTIEQGARCVLGGKRYDRTFFPMTVLVDVTAQMDIAKDMEVFGPVFPVIGFDTDEEALKIANASKYGLTGGVMGHDQRRAMKVAAKIECGSVVVNGVGNYRPPELGFGGVKASGLGREGISATLEEVSQVKTIILKGFR